MTWLLLWSWIWHVGPSKVIQLWCVSRLTDRSMTARSGACRTSLIMRWCHSPLRCCTHCNDPTPVASIFKLSPRWITIGLCSFQNVNSTNQDLCSVMWCEQPELIRISFNYQVASAVGVVFNLCMGMLCFLTPALSFDCVWVHSICLWLWVCFCLICLRLWSRLLMFTWLLFSLLLLLLQVLQVLAVLYNVAMWFMVITILTLITVHVCAGTYISSKHRWRLWRCWAPLDE